jgi:hypothetical protein
MPKALSSQDKRIVERTKALAKLTSRQRKFLLEYQADPSNATAAAVRAGYSAKSASVLASRLLANETIQGLLAQHFQDNQALISTILEKSLKKLDSIIETGGKRDALKAINTALHYTKVAAGVLGLKITPPSERSDIAPEMTLEDTIAALREELGKLETIQRESQSGESAGSTETSGASTLH